MMPASTLIVNLNFSNIVLGPFPSPGPAMTACVGFGKLSSKDCCS